MDMQPLYDLAPALELMALGLLIALGPLAWVAWRNRGTSHLHRLQALTLLVLFLTFDLVLFGAFTRLTDSGLGCPDWPGCYGQASPLGARAQITAAQDAMPTGPVTHSKAWVEMVHRYLATAVGVLIIAITIGTWRQSRKAREAKVDAPISPWWPLVTLIWVCIQGAFGALTVTMKLFPAIVTLHLVGGLILLVLLCVQAVRQMQFVQSRSPVPLGKGLRRGLIITSLLVGVQVVLGGWVSTNYAVLACTTFPMCQGSWWPNMNFAQGFEIWRELGVLRDGSYINFEALTAIHYVHRLAAYVVLTAMVVLSWRLWRTELAVQARWLAAMAGLQLLTGLSNVVLDWPILAAVLHTGGAAATVVILTWALASCRTSSVSIVLPALNGAVRVSA